MIMRQVLSEGRLLKMKTTNEDERLGVLGVDKEELTCHDIILISL